MSFFMRRLSYMPALLALVHQPAFPAAEPQKPTKSWMLDYSETNCLASRPYGSGDKSLVLAFRPSANGKVMHVTLARSRRAAQEAEHAPATVKFPGATFKTTALHYGADGKYEILRMNLDERAVEHLRSAVSIDIRAWKVQGGSFSIPGMSKLLAAMEECNRNLRAHWNMGEESTTLLSVAKPLAPLESYLNSEDYPAQAAMEDQEGSVKVTLMIDETGLVKDCVVEETSNVASLDAQTCIVLMKRAKFNPATNAAGQAVRSVLATGVTWRMP